MDEKSLEDQIRELREELNSIKKGDPDDKNRGEGIGNLFNKISRGCCHKYSKSKMKEIYYSLPIIDNKIKKYHNNDNKALYYSFPDSVVVRLKAVFLNEFERQNKEEMCSIGNLQTRYPSVNLYQLHYYLEAYR